MAKTKDKDTPAAPEGSITVRLVRYNLRNIRIEWENNGDSYAVTFHENPLPSFMKALEALPPHVADLCDMPDKDVEKITATGVTIRPLGEDNSQALIVARKTIRKGKRVFNISTPLLPMYSAKDAEKKGSDCMTEDQARAIMKVATEARKYIRGERAQGRLEYEEEKKGDGEGKEAEFPAMTEAGS
jgi:hypothetical protein